ncbi:MAG TPA: ABC transporter substrate-binding protein [Bacilli bacterium]|nr:ABC transporter substrate-binding protein [Bacilli bacterium]
MKPTIKKWMGALVALSLAGTLTACGNKQDNQDTAEQGTSAKEPQELSLVLDWYPNAVHSFIYAAEEQGYFKDENLKVDIQMPSDASDPLKLAAVGKVDAAISYETQVIQARSEDVPVISVAALVRHPLNVVMVREESGINSPKDLAGKNVGYPAVPLDEYFVRDMIEKDGGDATDTKFTDIGWDIIPSITGKQVDAIIGGYKNHEQLLLEKNGVHVKAFNLQDYGVPDFYELVLATGESTLKDKKPALEAFVRALGKGQAYVAAHKDEALNSLLAKQSTDFPLEEDVEKQSLDILLPLMDAGDKPFGYQDESVYQTMIDYMKEHKIITNDVKASEAMQNLVQE